MPDEGVALRAVGADSLLARLDGPAGLKALTSAELDQIAEQLRTAIIATTAVTGGHLGPSLGVVELTIALHRVMNSPVERIVNSSSDGVDIFVRGIGGHGAAPHTTIDPVVVASELVMALQTLVSRSIDPLEPGVVTVGVIQAGTKRNIISEEARLELTVRADNRETRDALIAGIQRIANGVARTHGVPEDRMPVVMMRETTPPNINHAESARTLRNALARSYGESRLSAVPRQGMGAEDFAYYGSPEWGSIPTVFFSVGGSVADDLRKAPPHHSPLFIIRPEPAVRGGVEGYTTAALTFLGRP